MVILNIVRHELDYVETDEGITYTRTDYGQWLRCYGGKWLPCSYEEAELNNAYWAYKNLAKKNDLNNRRSTDEK